MKLPFFRHYDIGASVKSSARKPIAYTALVAYTRRIPFEAGQESVIVSLAEAEAIALFIKCECWYNAQPLVKIDELLTF